MKAKELIQRFLHDEKFQATPNHTAQLCQMLEVALDALEKVKDQTVDWCDAADAANEALQRIEEIASEKK